MAKVTIKVAKRNTSNLNRARIKKVVAAVYKDMEEGNFVAPNSLKISDIIVTNRSAKATPKKQIVKKKLLNSYSLLQSAFRQ